MRDGPPAEKSDDGFSEFWDAYGKKVGKAASVKLWAKLSPKDREAAIAGIPTYKAAQPDPKYRKDPERYLRKRSWLDERETGHSGHWRTSSGKVCPYAPGTTQAQDWWALNADAQDFAQ